jgi:predicted DNA-binding transcriptional regulator AlpA
MPLMRQAVKDRARTGAFAGTGEKMPQRLVSMQEAREHYLGGLGRTTLYELIKRGELTQVHIGRRGFITADSLECYVARLAQASVA